MANRELTYDDLLQLVQLVKSASHFSEFRLKIGEIEVSLRRSNGAVQPRTGRDTEAPAAAPAANLSKSEPGERSFPPGAHLVRAPMVGTFYRASAPGQPPFVAIGQVVEADTTVCIIEVMKLMNSIEAGVKGVVREILAENAGAVEYGSVLMVIDPQR